MAESKKIGKHWVNLEVLAGLPEEDFRKQYEPIFKSKTDEIWKLVKAEKPKPKTKKKQEGGE